MNTRTDRLKQAATLLIATAALLFVACGADTGAEPASGGADTGTPQPATAADTGTPQSGGGSGPPPDLASVVQSLPRLPGMAADQATVATGRATVQAFFWAPDPPARVAEFYAAELPGRGWRPIDDAPVHSVSDAKDDGTTIELLTQRFQRGNVVLTVVTRPNEKDPARGPTHLSFEVAEQR